MTITVSPGRMWAFTTVAWYDPPALDPAGLKVGGAWASYWYNGFVYESNMTGGLNTYRLDDCQVKAKADRVSFLNPQTLIRSRGWRWHWHWHW